MSYVVKIEGQEIPVPDEIGGNDEAVKRALTPYYPEVANAMITRVEKDGVTTITVVKRAGTKGADPLEHLLACEGGKNPAIALCEEIEADDQARDPLYLVDLDARIEAAIEAGEQQARMVDRALERLKKTSAIPAPDVVMGF
jgi:hypothetical protein